MKTLAALAMLLFLWLGPMTPRPFAAPGDLDRTFGGFGADGFVITPDDHDPAIPRPMARQADGKLVVLGNSQLGWGEAEVLRYRADGTLDPTFGSGGRSMLFSWFTANSVAIQSDGKIVVAGTNIGNAHDYVVARLTPSGDLDPSFSGNGYVLTDIRGGGLYQDYAFAVACQPDGKILAGGVTVSPAMFPIMTMARYNSDGSLDETFGVLGTREFCCSAACQDIALQGDGKIIAVGSTFVDDYDFAVARLNPDGSDDDSFDGNGALSTDFGGVNDRARAVVIQPDGKIVVAGDDISNLRMARYLPNGAMDGSFDGDGKRSLVLPGGGGISDVVLQPDGRFVLVGHSAPGGDNRLQFFRLNANATLDFSFGGDGDVTVDLDADVRGGSLALEADGRITASGLAETDGLLVRLWPDGSLDNGGWQTTAFETTTFPPGSQEVVWDMAVQTDGKIVTVGQVSNAAGTEIDFALARFTAEGELDTSFGDRGRVALSLQNIDVARGVAIQLDGKIVVAGSTGTGSATQFMVARFNTNGTPDNTFGLSGFNVIDFAGGSDTGEAVAVSPDGKIVVAGTVYNGVRFVYGVARFTADGFVDNTFDVDGKQLIEFQVGAEHWATAVLVQPNSRIVVGGEVGGDFGILRLLENGALDTSFGTGGKTVTNMGGSDFITCLTLAGNGWIYAGGHGGVNEDFAVAQYKPDGQLPSCSRGQACSTWPAGRAWADWGGFDTAWAIDWRSDGRVILAGCAENLLGLVQFNTTDTTQTLKKTVDFIGQGECGWGIQYVANDKFVVAATQGFNGDGNFALARFQATPAPTTEVPSPTPTSPVDRLTRLSPNPTSGSVQIDFELPRPEHVRVAIYDVAGRVVAMPTDSYFPGGHHAITWDARQGSARLASGTYFVRLESPSYATTERLVLLR